MLPNSQWNVQTVVLQSIAANVAGNKMLTSIHMIFIVQSHVTLDYLEVSNVIVCNQRSLSHINLKFCLSIKLKVLDYILFVCVT